MRYKVEWRAIVADYPVAGYVIVEADGFADAEELADDLVDVDFFTPNRKVSASSPDVLGGRMWCEGVGYGGDLEEVLPDSVTEWTFDKIDVRRITLVDAPRYVGGVVPG